MSTAAECSLQLSGFRGVAQHYFRLVVSFDRLSTSELSEVFPIPINQVLFRIQFGIRIEFSNRCNVRVGHKINNYLYFLDSKS